MAVRWARRAGLGMIAGAIEKNEEEEKVKEEEEGYRERYRMGRR